MLGGNQIGVPAMDRLPGDPELATDRRERRTVRERAGDLRALERVEGLAERRDAPERRARVVRARGGGRERRQVRLAHAFAVADTHLPNALRFVPHWSSNPALSSLRCALQVRAALTRSSVVSSVVSWTFCETHLP